MARMLEKERAFSFVIQVTNWRIIMVSTLSIGVLPKKGV